MAYQLKCQNFSITLMHAHKKCILSKNKMFEVNENGLTVYKCISSVINIFFVIYI